MNARTLLVLFAFFASGSDCDQDRLDAIDNGRMVVTGPDGQDLELRVCAYPMTVSLAEGLDVAEAVDQWNAWVGQTVLEVVTDASAQVTVEVGYVPGDLDEGDEAGLAEVSYDSEGCILLCAVTVSADIAYDTAYARQVLLHELGHALGLADDPGPPATVDLTSVMSKPLDVLGVLTEHDRQILLAD